MNEAMWSQNNRTISSSSSSRAQSNQYVLISQVFLKSEEEIARMTAIESKEEISDTDSGIILHSGKNVTTAYVTYNPGLQNR